MTDAMESQVAAVTRMMCEGYSAADLRDLRLYDEQAIIEAQQAAINEDQRKQVAECREHLRAGNITASDLREIGYGIGAISAATKAP